jgi:hypothetical protein
MRFWVSAERVLIGDLVTLPDTAGQFAGDSGQVQDIQRTSTGATLTVEHTHLHHGLPVTHISVVQIVAGILVDVG